MPSSHLILGHPLLLLPPVFPSIRVFSSESTLRMRCPKYWSFSFSISPSKEIPGLISFRMDWLDVLAVQGTLKSPLQHQVRSKHYEWLIIKSLLVYQLLPTNLFIPCDILLRKMGILLIAASQYYLACSSTHSSILVWRTLTNIASLNFDIRFRKCAMDK